MLVSEWIKPSHPVVSADLVCYKHASTGEILISDAQQTLAYTKLCTFEATPKKPQNASVSFSFLCFASRKFPLIISSNDVLAKLRVVDPASLLWEEAHKTPIEDTSGDERVNVSDGKEMLATCGHNWFGINLLRDDNIADETWQRRSETDDESSDRPPVGCVLGRVAVDTMEVVHVRHRDVAAACDVVVRDEDSSHRS